VFFGIQNENEWTSFCELVLKKPALADEKRFNSNSKRVQHSVELKKVIEDSFSVVEAEEVVNRLELAKIANARLNSIKEFIDHPQLKQRNRWTEIDSEVGKLKALLPPVTIHGLNAKMGSVPKLGEH